MSDFIAAQESTAVDEIFSRTPVRLPMRLAARDTYGMDVNLGVRLRGGSAKAPAYRLAAVQLPAGWTIHREGPRHVTVHDQDDGPTIRAFDKFAGYENRDEMYLTDHARDLVRRRFQALPLWRRLFTNPVDWSQEGW